MVVEPFRCSKAASIRCDQLWTQKNYSDVRELRRRSVAGTVSGLPSPRARKTLEEGVHRTRSSGADRDRTDDLRLAKPALSQLSYSPSLVGCWCPSPGLCRTEARLLVWAPAQGEGYAGVVGQGRVELPTSRLSGVRSNHLSYWPSRPAGGRRQARNKLGPAGGKSEIPTRVAPYRRRSRRDRGARQMAGHYRSVPQN